ncbi:MAG: FHA domain-containing protein [Xanthomonadales bacterium]
MVFRRKKTASESSPGLLRPRGRKNGGNRPASPVSAAENPLARRFRVDAEPDTIDLEPAGGFRDSAEQEQDVPTTRILGGDNADAAPSENQALKDPVAGFLAVISGPGRGSVSMLHYGKNSIGRDVSQAIALDHGDRRISRENHCTVTYDPLNRKFYLQQGDGNKLTYLEGQPVLAPADLAAGNQIRVGDTVLRFVPLCGEDFDWMDH